MQKYYNLLTHLLNFGPSGSTQSTTTQRTLLLAFMCLFLFVGKGFAQESSCVDGLDNDADFVDIGREAVTNDPMDRAKFKTPTLRNIELTPPYMHDGRFKTLEEVVDHYNAGIQESATADPTVLNTKDSGLFLTDQDKIDLINFLKTLTDDTFLNNPEYASPF